jgi:transaldolase / glucose-6-phosphate isomerase
MMNLALRFRDDVTLLTPTLKSRAGLCAFAPLRENYFWSNALPGEDCLPQRPKDAKKARPVNMKRMEFHLGPLADQLNRAIHDAEQESVSERLWRKDASLWKIDEASQKQIGNSLGWLTVADEMVGVVGELVEFAATIRESEFRHVMVCGMGGSSLCPEVLARTFGQQSGFPELLVLDSTDPDVIARFRDQIDVEHCLFVIASKSGTTTEPTVFYKYWYAEVSKRCENPGENFIAITDPGSPLVDTAAELGFQRTFLNQPDIGGRYSALSHFGMVPAALMGIEIRKFLDRAKEAEQSSDDAMKVGAILGECANAGRDKLTLILDPRIETLGLWIEQLIAESTGKEERGILPVTGEPLGDASVYGDDRVFVLISIGPITADFQARLDALAAAGHPVIQRELRDVYDLGAEFFVWEFATACAGWRLGINPFDQPNVQEAKDATRELLSEFSKSGNLPDDQNLADDDAIRTQLQSIAPGDYVAFLNYVEELPEIDRKLQEIRTAVRDRTKCATTIGYGPRFLHSTGQLHKGGPNTGIFFQIEARDKLDFPVPGEPYSFSILKQAQALGDFRALVSRDRRVLRINLGDDLLSSLDHLYQVILNALK